MIPTDTFRSIRRSVTEIDVTMVMSHRHMGSRSHSGRFTHFRTSYTINPIIAKTYDVLNQRHDLSSPEMLDQDHQLFRTQSLLRKIRREETMISTRIPPIVVGDGVLSNPAMPLIAKRTLVSRRSFTRQLASAPVLPATRNYPRCSDYNPPQSINVIYKVSQNTTSQVTSFYRVSTQIL